MSFFKEELRRLKSGLIDSEPYSDSIAIVNFIVNCSDNATEVIKRTIKVLERVIENRQNDRCPEDDYWKTALPQWFVEECAEEMSKENAEEWLKKWRSLTPEQQAEQANQQRWALFDWLHWFSPGPDERQWRWAGVELVDNCCFRVSVAVTSWPTAYGALEWVLRASGALSVVEEE